ncbi:MAG TPA: alpha/beta hydrolase-fold protein [Pseudonocardiaceae bacterium]|nr:alpha/beta hydrolase-fold protein [Pseudonocardiaceae bacterium]
MRSPQLPTEVVAALDGAGGWLGSYWPGGAFLATAALLTAVAIRRGVRRAQHGAGAGRGRARGGVAGTAVEVTVIVLIAGLGGAFLVNAYSGYLPDTGALAGFAGLAPAASSGLAAADRRAGHVWRAMLGDPALGVPPSPLWIYTPPGYDGQARRRYPVVYLFHGYPGSSADWFRAGRIAHTMDVLAAHHLVPPAIVVAPDLNAGGVHDTEGLDAVDGPRIATWFTRDVVGWTDATLRTVPDRAHRVIGGMSSGGYAALDIALHHLDEFGAVLALEPYGDPGQAALARLGGNRAALRAHSPIAYLPGMHFTQPLPVFLDVGGWGDPRSAELLATALEADRQPVLFRIEPRQGHTWTEVRAGTPYGLVFAFTELTPHPGVSGSQVRRVGLSCMQELCSSSSPTGWAASAAW